MLETGTVVAERYRLDRTLGQGGMGAVWAATHVVTGKAVALKFLTQQGGDESSKKRLVREARAACSINHPHVVQVHDVLEIDGLPVLVMDLLRGESLGDRLERERTIEVDELVRIVGQMVSALEAAHARGVVHRDIKPDNVFLVKRPDDALDVKLLDFGIAKVTKLEDGSHAETAKLTGTGAMIGTPYYMAPEQVFGEQDVDARSDLWSVGILLYECVAGVRPTEGANLGQILKLVTVGPIKPLQECAAQTPPGLARIVDRCLQRDRQKRFASATELREALERFSAGNTFDGTEKPIANTLEGAARPKRGLRVALAAAAVVGVLGIGGGVAMRARSTAANAPAQNATSTLAATVTTAAPAPAPPPVREPEPAPVASAPAAAPSPAPAKTEVAPRGSARRPNNPKAAASPPRSNNDRGPGGVVMTPSF